MVSERESAESGGDLTPSQRAMVETWDRHVAFEFETKSIEATMETMTREPYVNHVPVMTGGTGREAVRRLYSSSLIPAVPEDSEITLVSRTVCVDRVVDELVYQFTHSLEMPFILPGVPPTGKRVEVALVVVVYFEGGRISREHIYWDQASVLTQLDLVDPSAFPVTGADSAHKVLDPCLPANTLIHRVDRGHLRYNGLPRARRGRFIGPQRSNRARP